MSTILIGFYLEEKCIHTRCWAGVPRVGDTCNFAGDKNGYKVVSVHWADHVHGDGTPIVTEPCSIVTLELTTPAKEQA